MFELLTGYNPFADDNPKVTYEKTLHLDIKWPSYINTTAKVTFYYL